MDKQLPLVISLIIQLISFALVISTTGLLYNLYFGLFWLATIAVLFFLLEQSRWDSVSWFTFGAFSATMIVAVLFSLRAVQDTTGLGIPIIGLLFVVAVLQLLPGKQVRTIRKQPKPVIAIRGGKKFHEAYCPLIRNKDGLMTYRSKEDALNAGKEPCQICLEE